jgi:histidine triad (HIT) family protein
MTVTRTSAYGSIRHMTMPTRHSASSRNLDMADSPPPELSDCDFCQIGAGKDGTAEVVCESKDWVAFFPTDPATPGHTLVIPRKHFTDLWSTDTSIAGVLMEAVVRVGQVIRAALKPEGMNLITSSGTVAEQTVFHLHFHLVPRWSGDGFGEIWPPKKRMKEQVKDSARARIREACQSLAAGAG